jgi:hypothetical protein
MIFLPLTPAESPNGAGKTVAVRISETHSVEASDRAAQVRYHCFRGRVSPDSVLYLEAVRNANETLKDDCELVNVRAKSSSPTLNMVRLNTTDEECFDVHRNILRPCISMTQAVQGTVPLSFSLSEYEQSTPSTQVAVASRRPPPRTCLPSQTRCLFAFFKLTRLVPSSSDSAKDEAAVKMVEVTVDVDCLVLDRVLIYLEKEAVGTADSFAFDLNQTEVLLAAATKLGCRGLEEQCQRRMGAFKERIRTYSWAEVCDRCKAGEMWICVDGMVLDVTRWLPEHPGGSKIIPGQALGVDATVFFELYHVSRQSFLYLKQFYIGEVAEEDLKLIPNRKDGQLASAGFLEQLKQFTTFRMAHKLEVKAFKSF